MKKLLSEFKTFAIKGNMIDMAVGIIVGGAFTAIITSIVTNIAMPLISILIGFDFKEWEIELPRLYGNATPGKLGIGLFINSIINFIVVAITLFLFVKALNKFKSRIDASKEPEPEKDPELTKGEQLLTEIRDILSQKDKTITENSDQKAETIKEDTEESDQETEPIEEDTENSKQKVETIKEDTEESKSNGGIEQ